MANGLKSILNIGYHGSPFYQDIMSQGFKGGTGQSSRFLGMKMPTWAGSGKTFVGSNPNVALRYGAPIEVAKSARNFTLPFGGGFDKSGISFGKETALDPKQATKGMRLMEKLRSGVYSASPTAQRLLSTGTTAATSGGGIGITRALMSSPMMATTLVPTLIAQHLYGPLASEADKVMGLAGETADEELLDEAFQYLGKNPFTPGDSFRSMNDPTVYGTIEDDLDEYSDSELMESDTTKKEGILSKLNPLKALGFLVDLFTGGSARKALGRQGVGKLFGMAKDAVRDRFVPASYGTSQAAFNAMTPSQQQAVGSIYGQGGIMQGYNPVSFFGRGPASAIQNRIDNILGRKAPQTAASRAKVKQLQQALTDVGGGDGGGKNQNNRQGGFDLDQAGRIRGGI